MNIPRHTRIFILAGVVTLIAALAIRIDVSEWLRGGFGWRWEYVPLDLLRSLPLLAVLLVYVAGAYALLKRANGGRLAVVWSMLGTLFVTLVAIAIRDGDPLFELFARTASQLGTGPHWVATHIDWASGEWRNWAAEMVRFGGHLNNLPPGSVLWYAWLTDVLDGIPALARAGQQALMPLQCNNYDLIYDTPGQWTSTIFGILMPIWAALTPVALFALAKRTAPANARAVVLWYPLIPGLAAFAGTWNTLYPLIAVCALLLLIVGCQRESPRPLAIFVSGLLTGIGIFINFALVPLGLLLGLWVLWRQIVIKRRRIVQVILIGIYYTLGLVTVWIGFWIASVHNTPFDLLSTAMSFHLGIDRPYGFWAIMHTWDWLLWGGLAFAVVLIANLGRWLAAKDRSLATLPSMSLVLALTMMIMVFSGTARGETGRVWLFFAPFLLIAAAESPRTSGQPLTKREWLWLGIPQAALLAALITSIPAVSADFRPPPTAPQVTTSHDVDALFVNQAETESFRLIGWDASLTDDSLILRLNWQGVTPSTTPLWFGAVLVGDGSETIPVDAWQPGGASRYPTTCWRAGSVIGDEITIPLDGHQAETWWVSLAAFGDPAQPEGRLNVRTDGGEDTQIGLGPITRDG
ncbi:MAG: hypothetical protein IT320_09310 [Anaerolineae bacterium]|nr:hypothetical protein [Anaerolineae bacterium]